MKRAARIVAAAVVAMYCVSPALQADETRSQWPNEGVKVSDSRDTQLDIHGFLSLDGKSLWSFVRTYRFGAGNNDTIIAQKIDASNGELLLGDSGVQLAEAEGRFVKLEVHQKKDGSFVIVYYDNAGALKLDKKIGLIGVKEGPDNTVVTTFEQTEIIYNLDEMTSLLTEKEELLIVFTTDRNEGGIMKPKER